MILQSSSKSDSVTYATFIKKKDEQNWEKPSQSEGKKIKMSLEELAVIYRLLEKKVESWKGFHSYEGTKTSIELNWSGDDEIQIKVDQYLKPIKGGQLDILRLFVKHLLKEKVEFATESKPSQNGFYNGSPNGFKDSNDAELKPSEPKKPIVTPKKSPPPPPKKSLPPKKTSSTAKEPEIAEISGVVEKTTEKAIQVRLESGEEKWLPKSRIHSEFDPVSPELQLFRVESWILKKKDNNNNSE